MDASANSKPGAGKTYFVSNYIRDELIEEVFAACFEQGYSKRQIESILDYEWEKYKREREDD